MLLLVHSRWKYEAQWNIAKLWKVEDWNRKANFHCPSLHKSVPTKKDFEGLQRFEFWRNWMSNVQAKWLKLAKLQFRTIDFCIQLEMLSGRFPYLSLSLSPISPLYCSLSPLSSLLFNICSIQSFVARMSFLIKLQNFAYEQTLIACNSTCNKSNFNTNRFQFTYFTFTLE